MTITEALCIVYAGWMDEDQRELYESARQVILKDVARMRLEAKIKKTEKQLAGLKGKSS
jgi:hypothetical protein